MIREQYVQILFSKILPERSALFCTADSPQKKAILLFIESCFFVNGNIDIFDI